MKERFPGQRYLLRATLAAGLTFGGCADTLPIPRSETPLPTGVTQRATPTPSEASATPNPSESMSPPKPIEATDPLWYLTGGPHFDGLSNSIRYAIDIAPGNSNDCPRGAPVTDSPFPSPTEGRIIFTGDSIVEVATPSGEILGAMHLANIKVKEGDEIETGELLGDPSCDSPPGGRTDGTHIHLYLKDIDGKPAPMADVEFSDGTVYESANNYDGFMIKGNVTKTADTHHCGPNVCEGIRNDLSEPLRLISTGHGSFRIELRYADGSPVLEQRAYIFKAKKDINGNSVPDEEVKGISSGNTGLLQATLPPGEYMLLFGEYDNVKGGRFAENESRVGTSGIDVNQDQTTTERIDLGRITVNLKQNPQKPARDYGVTQARVCVNDQDSKGQEYEIECQYLSDLSQDGLGKSQAVFDLMPDDSYIVRYFWSALLDYMTNFEARIVGGQGQTRVIGGQITEFNCLVFAPETSQKNQPASCTARIIKQ